MPNETYQAFPVPNFRFTFKVDKAQIGTFQEVSGLEVKIDASFQIEEGGQNQVVHKLPGRMTWENIVLKRGVVESDNLFEWLAECSGDGFTGTLTRRTATIALLTPDSKPFRQWDLAGAFPVRWTGPSFDAGSTDYATEELEIAHHGFEPKTG